MAIMTRKTALYRITFISQGKSLICSFSHSKFGIGNIVFLK